LRKWESEVARRKAAKEGAAVTVQKVWRGRKARQARKSLEEERDLRLAQEQAAQEKDSAIKIQKVWRGHESRKVAEELRAAEARDEKAVRDFSEKRLSKKALRKWKKEHARIEREKAERERQEQLRREEEEHQLELRHEAMAQEFAQKHLKGSALRKWEKEHARIAREKVEQERQERLRREKEQLAKEIELKETAEKARQEELRRIREAAEAKKREREEKALAEKRELEARMHSRQEGLAAKIDTIREAHSVAASASSSKAVGQEVLRAPDARLGAWIVVLGQLRQIVLDPISACAPSMIRRTQCAASIGKSFKDADYGRYQVRDWVVMKDALKDDPDFKELLRIIKDDTVWSGLLRSSLGNLWDALNR